jgi:hypothetical protein
VFQKPGSAGNQDMIRILDPTASYPNGYARVHNEYGQPVDVNGSLSRAELGPVLACTRTVVVAARAFEDGRLEMVFGDGSLIRVGAPAEFEGWELAGPGGMRIVAGPGPKLTVWPGQG